jgi:hypothetical protein
VSIRPGIAIVISLFCVSFAYAKSPKRKIANQNEVVESTSNANSSGIEYRVFIKRLFERFDKSLNVESLERVAKVAQLNSAAIDAESPWALQSKIQGVPITFSSSPGIYYSGSTELTYRSRDGIVGTIGAAGVNFSAPTVVRQNTFTGYATIGIDITSGGVGSVLNQDAELRQIQAQAPVLEASRRTLDQQLLLVERATMIFSDLCKLSDLQSITTGVRTSLLAGRQKFATKTGTAREFLVLKEVMNSFLRRIEEFQSRISETEFMLSRIDESLGGVVRKLIETGADCRSAEPSKVAIKAPSAESLRSIAQNLPFNSEFELQRNIATKDLSVAKSIRRPSVVPFVGVESQSILEPRAEPIQGITAGINLRYDFPGDDNSFNERAIVERISLAGFRQRIQINDTVFMFRSIYRDIEQQMAMLDMVDTSIQNSKQLLKLLDTQQAIGVTDASAASSAYINFAEGLIARREVWRNVQTGIERLTIYKAIGKDSK